jgi:hypothetical protein
VKTHNLSLLTNKASCSKCGKWTLLYSTKHKCKTVSSKGQTMKSMTSKDEETDLFNDVWVADMECFPDEDTGVHTPYLIVMKSINEKNPLIFSGKKCLRNFIRCICHDERIKGTLWFHNGSGYDFNFIIKGMMEDTHNEIELIKRGNRILTFTVKNKPKLTVRDLYLFLPSSLEKLSKDFKLEDKSKGKFDHGKIFSWKSVMKHIAEATDYCTQDVIATQEIIKKFSTALYKVCPLSMTRTISIASHAMMCWRLIENVDVVEGMYIPSKEMDFIFREAYFGGRSGPIYAKWDSEFYKNLDDDFFFDENGFLNVSCRIDDDDSIVLLDIVSQYPAAMKHNKYPCGKPVKKEFDLKYGLELAELFMETIYFKKGEWKKLKEKMFRSVYCVDITPPRDIYIAYLMSRDEKGKNKQNLYEKKKKWYSGIDLYEAVKIGYKVTLIHAQISFPESKLIFSKYIDLLFKIKEENKHDKTSTLYIVAKLLMNALYGKFAQKIHSNYTCVMSKLPKNPEKTWEKLHNFEIESIFKSETLKRIGYIVKADKIEKDVKVTYPCYVSMCVVAYARRDISKKMRSINGYRDPETCYLYTDTDSILIKKNAFNKLPRKYIGKELGQFENEFPNARIIAYRSLAPKTYCLCLLIKKGEKYTLAYKVRCKGIPHIGTLIEKTSLMECMSANQVMKIVNEDIEDLKVRYYILHKTDEANLKKNGVSVPFLDIETYNKCLTDNYTVTCFFGTMVKNKKTYDKKDLFSIRCDWALRRLVMTNYWNSPSCDRLISDWSKISRCRGNYFDTTMFDNKIDDIEESFFYDI